MPGAVSPSCKEVHGRGSERPGDRLRILVLHVPMGGACRERVKPRLSLDTAGCLGGDGMSANRNLRPDEDKKRSSICWEPRSGQGESPMGDRLAMVESDGGGGGP